MKIKDEHAAGAAIPPADLSPLVTMAEAAKLCRVSLPTWERLSRRHETPPAVLIGRRRFHRRADVLAWIDSRVVIAGRRGETVAPVAA